MAQLRPFRGLRADNALAHEIIAPPYDVVSEADNLAHRLFIAIAGVLAVVGGGSLGGSFLGHGCESD